MHTLKNENQIFLNLREYHKGFLVISYKRVNGRKQKISAR